MSDAVIATRVVPKAIKQRRRGTIAKRKLCCMINPYQGWGVCYDCLTALNGGKKPDV